MNIMQAQHFYERIRSLTDGSVCFAQSPYRGSDHSEGNNGDRSQRVNPFPPSP